MAEPAVGILNKRVEDITHGIISRRVMMVTISIGVALSMVLVVLRILFNIPFIWLVIPLYSIILISAYFCTPIFTAIAFDSGGVASGTMATSFILPFAMGLCVAKDIDILNGAFGTISIIACIPILCILILGLVYRYVSYKQAKKQQPKKKTKVVIVDFDWGE